MNIVTGHRVSQASNHHGAGGPWFKSRGCISILQLIFSFKCTFLLKKVLYVIIQHQLGLRQHAKNNEYSQEKIQSLSHTSMVKGPVHRVLQPPLQTKGMAYPHLSDEG